MRNFFLIAVVLFFSCTNNQQTGNWKYYDGAEKEITEFDQYNATVITFLSPQCPLSENYTRTLNELENTFKIENVRFINVFPGKYYSRNTIDSFITNYNVTQSVLFDENFDLTNQLDAGITPESFIINKHGAVVYKGAIDNWAVDLGQKRQVITEFYVRDVLYALLNGSKLPYHKTTAVGCFIEKK
ncbi:MAG: redoxin domain-containing protein [Bacteroidetes bacterium]|nr:redoxin domain-containing protein [Bacteroidota bacterium]